MVPAGLSIGSAWRHGTMHCEHSPRPDPRNSSARSAQPRTATWIGHDGRWARSTMTPRLTTVVTRCRAGGLRIGARRSYRASAEIDGRSLSRDKIHMAAVICEDFLHYSQAALRAACGPALGRSGTKGFMNSGHLTYSRVVTLLNQHCADCRQYCSDYCSHQRYYQMSSGLRG